MILDFKTFYIKNDLNQTVNTHCTTKNIQFFWEVHIYIYHSYHEVNTHADILANMNRHECSLILHEFCPTHISYLLLADLVELSLLV